MYSRAVPMPGDVSEDDAPLYDETKDANNPDNFEDFEEEIDVKSIR